MSEERSRVLSLEAVLAEEAVAIHGTPGSLLQAISAWRPAPKSERDIGSKPGVGPDDQDAARRSLRRQQEFYQALNRLDSTALCLSGGGIRSAAFNLGVIQALATHPTRNPGGATATPEGDLEQNARASLLAQFHYLSTVSGGGYIGTWLSAWLHHAKRFAIVWANLVTRPCGPDVEPGTLAWLRAYSNYLSPKAAVLSADIWAGAAIAMRNLLLNWLIILPWVCALILLIKGIVLFSVGYAHHASEAAEPLWGSPWTWQTAMVLLLAVALAILVQRFWRGVPWKSLGAWISVLAAIFAAAAWLGTNWFWPRNLLIALVGIAVVSLVCSLAFTTAHRPSQFSERQDEPAAAASGGGAAVQGVDQRAFILASLLPSLLSAAALTQSLASNLGLLFLNGFVAGDRPHVLGQFFLHRQHWKSWWTYDDRIVLIGSAAILGAVVYAISYGLGKAFRAWTLGRAPSPRWEKIAWMLAGAVHGALVGVGASLYRLATTDAPWLFNDLLLPLMFGVPFFLVAQMVAEMIFVGLASTDDSEADREWLGRAAGWTLATAVFWFLVPFLTMAGSLLVNDLAEALRSWLAPVGGIAGGLTAWLAKSAFSPGRGEAKGILPVSSNVALAIAAPVFGAALVIFLSAVLEKLLFEDSLVISLRYSTMRLGLPKWWEALWWLAGGFVVTLTIALGASRAVNINRFSLHAVYRNRLMRAFLGASRPRRTPDAFTGFDEGDNLRVWQLWPGTKNGRPRLGSRKRDWRPFHIINMTLNVVSTRRLSWQQRKAEPFTVTPLHSGSACKAYRPSRWYGDRNGISLGTAMAISGAAASPNMGYHSSPAVTFLMALFNVRLGWWLGNPGPEGAETFQRRGPRWAVGPLIQETFGLTTDQRAYVYLSDGGHFENLGLYEMVRRRCRCIVVCDAGADPDFAFEDLGGAVRKIALDLGITIRFLGLNALKPRPKKDAKQPVGGVTGALAPYHALGVIDYAAADGAGAPGLILYVKAGYHGVESPGVQSYATANPAFPHEPTSDQFFSEDQFESYRALGYEIMDGLLRSAAQNVETINQAAAERDSAGGPLSPGSLRHLVAALHPETIRQAEDALKPAVQTPSETIKSLDQEARDVLRDLLAARTSSSAAMPR